MNRCTYAKFLADFHCKMPKAFQPKHEVQCLHYHLEPQLILGPHEAYARLHLVNEHKTVIFSYNSFKEDSQSHQSFQQARIDNAQKLQVSYPTGKSFEIQPALIELIFFYEKQTVT